MDCGSNDQWLNINQRFAKTLQDRKVPLEFRQLPGDHSWSYWDKQVQEVLRVASEMLLPSDST